MSIRLWGLTAIGLAIAGQAGCKVECETSQDCPSGAYQCVDNKCVLPARPQLPDLGQPDPIDIGPVDVPDRGFFDVGFRDIGFRPFDLGPLDGGPDIGPVDTGVVTGPVDDVEALVEVAAVQVNSDGGPTVAEARILDYTQSGRSFSVQSRDGCTITFRGLGTPIGLSATRIEVRNGSARVDLVETSPGIFENTAQTDPSPLLQIGTVTYDIVSSEATGTLAAASASAMAPLGPLFPPTPPQNEIRLDLVSLAPTAGQGANRFEMYDETRSTVVDCPMNVNSVAVPFFVRDLYPAGSRVTMDIRKQAEVSVSVEVIDRGSINVRFRAARTIRYTVIIP